MQADRITKETPGSEVFFVDGRPVKPKTVLEKVDRAIGKWSTKKMDPIAPAIPAGTDKFGRRTIRNSLSDPGAARRGLADPARNDPRDAGEKVSRPLGPPIATPALERVGRMFSESGDPGTRPDQQKKLDDKMAWLTEGTDITAKDLKKPEYASMMKLMSKDTARADEGISGALTGLEMVNDANILTGRLRQDWANDPDSAKDDPVTVFETPDGKTKFTARNTATSKDERIAYYQIGNNIIEAGDYEKTFTNPDGSPVDPIARRLPDGRVITTELIKTAQETGRLEDYVVVAPTDPRAKGREKQADGRYYAPIAYELADGSRLLDSDYLASTPTEWLLPDGGTLDFESIPKTAEEWKSAFYQYRAPDRKTVVMNADGSVPEDMQRAHMEQRGNRGLANLKIANPRAPWQDTAGVNAWETGYESDKSAWREALPWFIDANLSSAPYYVPGYNILATAADAAPYAMGLDGSTREPNGWNDLGNGTYSDQKLTNSQALGGFTSAVIGGLAERFGNKAIGGIADLPGINKLIPKRAVEWFGKTAPRRMLSSAIGEGIEELWSAPSMELQQAGYLDYGRPRYQNEQTGEWEYDRTKPAGFATPTALSNYAVSGASGFALGGPITAGGELVSRARTGNWNNQKKRDLPKMDIPEAAPSTSLGVPDSLDRRYKNEEW